MTPLPPALPGGSPGLSNGKGGVDGGFDREREGPENGGASWQEGVGAYSATELASALDAIAARSLADLDRFNEVPLNLIIQ